MDKLSVGYIQNARTIADLRAAFAEAHCAGIATNDVTPDIKTAILSLTAADIDKMRGLKICYREGNVYAHIQNRPYFPIGHECVHTMYGLPPALQSLLAADFEDYATATGKDATTRLVVGNQLELNWHADLSRTAEQPIQHRNLSPNGMFIATSQNGIAVPYNKVSTTAFFHVAAMQQLLGKGELEKRQQGVGERFIFRHNLAHRSNRVAGDSTLYALQLRAITSYHPSRT